MIYNTYEVANIMGVNPSTIKRWADSGKILCYKTRGGHRKFHLKHLRDFVKSDKKNSSNVNLPTLIGKNDKIIKAVESADSKKLSKFIYNRLIEGDKNKFLTLTNSLIIKGFPYYFIFDEIIIPTLINIGKQWQKGKISITKEHLASELIRKFLLSIDNKVINSKVSVNAFCFTLTQDSHDLPLSMAEVIFNQTESVFTFNLGANLPADDFINESLKIKPHFVFISIVYIHNKKIIEKEVDKILNKFKNSDTHIFLSGKGIDYIDIKLKNYTKIQSYKQLQHNIISLLS